MDGLVCEVDGYKSRSQIFSSSWSISRWQEYIYIERRIMIKTIIYFTMIISLLRHQPTKQDFSRLYSRLLSSSRSLLQESLLLFLSLSALLLLSASPSDICSLHELQNRALLFLLVLELHGFPHFVDLSLARAFCLVFHVTLLLSGLNLEIVLGEGLIFISHHLPLTPFFKTSLVILSLVPPQ